MAKTQYQLLTQNFSLANSCRFPQKKITMSIKKYNSSMSVEINFGTQNSLRVNGDDPEHVLGIFEELKREIELSKPKGEFIRYLGKTLFGHFLIAIFCAAFVYSIFDIGLNVTYELLPDFKNSEAASTIALIGWILVLVFFAGSPIILPMAIEKHYPSFEFSGTNSRQKFAQFMGPKTIAGFIVLPILLNLVSAFLKDIHLLLK